MKKKLKSPDTGLPVYIHKLPIHVLIDDIGPQMANMFFNWSQDDGRFSASERKMMKDLQEAWDRAKGRLHDDQIDEWAT
jgi:hypothetical protein